MERSANEFRLAANSAERVEIALPTRESVSANEHKHKRATRDIHRIDVIDYDGDVGPRA